MKKIFKYFTIFFLAIALLAPTAPIFAVQNTSPIQAIDLLPPQISKESGLGDADLRITVARIIRVAMGLLGIVTVVIILMAGFTWMISGGDEEKTAEAKRLLVNGIIGIAIILSSYAITNFVITQLVAATTQSGGQIN